MVLVIACILTVVAALIHVAIFWMESVGWTRPAIWTRFQLSDQAQADANRDLAFNQGFYNLFLALGALVGVVLMAAGLHSAGFALIFLSVGSMLAASLVLLSLGTKFAAAALTQGLAPLIALILTVIAAATG